MFIQTLCGLLNGGQKPHDLLRHGLSYVQVEMNGNGVEAMLDTGATHNFVANCMVQKLGLKVSKCPSKIKAVNSKVKPISGIAFAFAFDHAVG